MTARPVILIDDGGVMNDNRVRGPQWQRLVGEFFTPLLGGTPAAWAEANYIVSTRFFEPANWRTRVKAAPDYQSFVRVYWHDWIIYMCQLVGVSPPSEDKSIELAQQAEAYITCRVHSDFPGAIDAIRQLHAQGYTLHTASGEPSANLQGYLEAMGVRACFGHLYGPDLLNTLKEGPEYHARLFADAQIAPEEALVVDDSPRVLAWARELGATVVLVSAEKETTDGMMRIGSLAELPEFIHRLA